MSTLPIDQSWTRRPARGLAFGEIAWRMRLCGRKVDLDSGIGHVWSGLVLPLGVFDVHPLPAAGLPVLNYPAQWQSHVRSRPFSHRAWFAFSFCPLPAPDPSIRTGSVVSLVPWRPYLKVALGCREVFGRVSGELGTLQDVTQNSAN